jgi:hypothetical protein
MGKIRKHIGIAIGTVIGLAAGYMYWSEVGCVSGSCPITSSPVNSSLYGAIMGGLGASLFKKDKN